MRVVLLHAATGGDCGRAPVRLKLPPVPQAAKVILAAISEHYQPII